MRYRKFDDVDAENINTDSEGSSTDGGYAFGAGRSAGSTMGDEVAPHVFVSDLATVKAHKEEIDSEIDTVISVCQDAVEFEQADLIHLPIAETDMQESQHGGTKSFDQFVRAASTIQDHVEAGEAVLVHCHAGINRSVGTTAAALGRSNRVLPDSDTFDALTTIQDERPRANPLQLTRGWMRAWEHGLGHGDATAVDAIITEVDGTRSSSGWQGVNRTRTRPDMGATVDESRETGHNPNRGHLGMFGSTDEESSESAANDHTDDEVRSESDRKNGFLSSLF